METIELVFLAGIIIFIVSSIYFYIAGKNKNILNSAFLVSFITLISYVLMWQGNLTALASSGQPIFWTRWLFYGASCTLLIYEIAQLKNIKGQKLVELLYLTAIVMFTGFLAALDLSEIRWIYFGIITVAYILLISKVISLSNKESKWVNSYIIFGWTGFPVVFLLAPTGLGLIGTSLGEMLYLLLDIYTKIIFNIQLGRKS